MKDGRVASGTATVFWAHGGTREPAETIAPSYEAEHRPQVLSQALSGFDNPALAPWVAHERFAPPGPGLAALPTVHLVLPLFGLVGSYPAVPHELPEALLDEPTVLQHIADLVEDRDPAPAMELDQPEAQGDWLPPEPIEPALELLPPPYWGTTTDPVRNAELADGQGIPAEPSPAGEEQPGALSWLDEHLRTRQEPQPVVPFTVPETPLQRPVVEEIPRESGTEPQLPVLEPAQRPVVADGPRPRRIEPRLPKRTYLPSLFTPPAKAPPERAVDDAPRQRRFGWRMRRTHALPVGIPASPVVPEVTEAPAVPAVVEDPRPEFQVPATPEPLPVLPAHGLPPLSAGTVPQEAKDEPAAPVGPAAYWAEPNWTESGQTTPDQPESLAWTPPKKPLAGLPGARRTTPAMDGLWETEPAGAADAGSASQPGAGRIVRRVATIGAGVGVLAAACVAVLYFLPRAFVSNLVPAATFNAPMMVLRANAPGRVVTIAVQNGQTVDPNTLLLTIRTEPQPDPAASLLRARLEAAQARLSELDQSLSQAMPLTDAGRTRMADLRRQRAAAVLDVAQLQDGVTNIPAAKSADLPVRAGIHGVIRSLEARAGTMTAAGVPLVRMLDCDHAFLTVAPDSKLQAGQAVQVRLPNLPPVAAIVRQSAGIAEPPDSLVIATPPGAFIGQLSGSCPIGATATITPSMTGS